MTTGMMNGVRAIEIVSFHVIMQLVASGLGVTLGYEVVALYHPLSKVRLKNSLPIDVDLFSTYNEEKL